MISLPSALRVTGLLAGAFILSGCVESFEGVRPATGAPTEVVAIAEDRGRDAAPLSQLEAGIYIDPDGCQIWMIDDGLEGYWSRRVDPRTGRPVCTDIAPPNSIVGNISTSPGIRDSVPARP